MRPIDWIVGGAFLLRVSYIWLMRQTPIGQVLLIDSDFYHKSALAIMEKGVWGEQVFFMNPFYSYFLALIYSLFGVQWEWVWLLQALMGCAICYATYGIGRSLWDEMTGCIAAGLLGCCGVLIFYEGALLTATPIVCFNLLALYLLLGKRSPLTGVRSLAAGILLGLSATARPFSLLVALALLYWIYRTPDLRLTRHGSLLWAGVLLILLPVVLRNFLIGGEWGLTTSSAGMNFYVGNHHGANGIYAQVDFLSSAEPNHEREEFIAEAQRRCGCTLTPQGASRYWLGEGLRFIWEQPIDYLRLMGKKAYWFVNRVEAQNNLSFYFARDFIPLLNWTAIGWWFFMPLAMAGWFHAYRDRTGQALELYVLCYIAGCMLFFVSSEYRLPIVPILALYSAHCLRVVIRLWQERKVFELWPMGCIAVGMAVPVLYGTVDAERLMLRRVDYYNFGALYERQGMPEKAADLYGKSLRIDPNFAPAVSALNRLKLMGETPGHTARQLGDWAFQRSEFSRAVEQFSRAVAQGDNRSETLNNLGLSLYKVGDYNEAENVFSRLVREKPAYAKAYFNWALVLIAKGDPTVADSLLMKAIEHDPRYGQAIYRRGQLAAERGDVKEAILLWEELDQLVGGDASLRSKIEGLKGDL